MLDLIAELGCDSRDGSLLEGVTWSGTVNGTVGFDWNARGALTSVTDADDGVTEKYRRIYGSLTSGTTLPC